MKIHWLDGQSSEGKFVIELTFTTGTGYLKKKSYEDANQDAEFFLRVHDGVTSIKVYDPSWNVVKTLVRENVRVAV